MPNARARLLLALLAAFPTSAVLLSQAAPATVDAATKKATPTPKKTATHKKKHKKATPTPTPKPKHKKAKPKPSATPRPTATPKPTTGPTLASGDFAGPQVTTRWGPVTVTITVQNHKITDVHVAATPETARSRVINDRAIPVLVQETLQAQSAQIDLVAGATQLSQGFVRSLQGAIQKASS